MKTWFIVYLICTGLTPSCTSIVIPQAFKTESTCNFVAQRELWRFRDVTYICLNTSTAVYQ